MSNEAKEEKTIAGGAVGKVYDDLVHPSAQEVGKTVHRAVNLALAPVNGALWTLEQALSWVTDRATDRLRASRTPVERIQPPRLEILGTIVAGVQAVSGEPTVSELFAGLLATAMDGEQSSLVHPAYSRIIRELVPDEARLLTVLPSRPYEWTVFVQLESTRGDGSASFVNVEPDAIAHSAGCENPKRLPMFWDNLNRLGLITFEWVESISTDLTLDSFLQSRLGTYVEGTRFGVRQAVESMIEEPYVKSGGPPAYQFVLRLKNAVLTGFGSQFCKACGIDSWDRTRRH